MRSAAAFLLDPSYSFPTLKPETAYMPKLKDVNTTSILAAIELGCGCMHNMFDADDDDCPLFSSRIKPTTGLYWCTVHAEAHVSGRHLNALLNAEDAAGIVLEEDAVDNNRRSAFLSQSGAVPLTLNRAQQDGPPINFCPHNLREGIHALYALVTYREDTKASAHAASMIGAIRDYWTPTTSWDIERLEALGLVHMPCEGELNGVLRGLGPLVKYYRATGYGPALELALVMKNFLVEEIFFEDGSFDRERFGTNHIHSITCVTSSLAQLADLLGDGALMSRVKAFYDNGLNLMRDAFGWSPELVGQEASDHGECNNSGDILEVALILGRWGYIDCYHDAERIIRCHLLPAQVRDVSFIDEPDNPDGLDRLRDVADRHLGSFGFPAPYGHESVGKGRGNLSFNMDIVGGTVGSLCEAYREIVRSGPAGTKVNLLFDVETADVRVESPYTHDCLNIEMKRSGPLSVRIPPWVDRDVLAVQGADVEPLETNGYLFFSDVAAGSVVQIRFPLAESEMTLSGDVHIQPIPVKMKGDAVVAMENFGADLTFFDAI
jgi:hypothetical protein